MLSHASHGVDQAQCVLEPESAAMRRTRLVASAGGIPAAVTNNGRAALPRVTSTAWLARTWPRRHAAHWMGRRRRNKARSRWHQQRARLARHAEIGLAN
jgi:hypothetical protein